MSAENTQEPQRVLLLGEIRKGRAGNPGEMRAFTVSPDGGFQLTLDLSTIVTAVGSLSTAVVAAIAASAEGTVMHLSGSTSGRPIKITQTSTAGNTIHTAVSGSTQFDSIYLFAGNTDSTARKLTLEWGGTTSPDDLIEVTIPPEHGMYVVANGQKLNGGLVVKAFCATANVVNITGWAVRK